jgi:alpha-ribazole phosphatase/probable phosphoglycerate mutase
MSVELVFETHSTSTDNETGVATGWLEGRLSEVGRRQATALGERRRADGISTVYTSDLARAVETAAIAFAGTTVPVRQDSRLRECDYGRLNGSPVACIEAERSGRVDEPFPGGESYRDVVTRMRAFLGDVARSHDGERVLVVGHSATRWALEHLLQDVPLEDLVVAPFDWREGWEYVVPRSLDWR